MTEVYTIPPVPAHLVQLLTANIPTPPASYWPTDRDPARCAELWTTYLTDMAADIWRQAWQQAFTAGATHGMSTALTSIRVESSRDDAEDSRSLYQRLDADQQRAARLGGYLT